MEDKILVILNEDANHTFESEESVIGRVGEGGIAQFEITIPEKLTNGSLYLDFKKPNGEKIRTRRLDINGGKAVYDVEKYLLTDDGEIKVQAVFVTSSGKTWKSSKKKYNILKSVNAVHDIPDKDKDDFLTEAQKVVFGFDDRIKALEQWREDGNYTAITASFGVSPTSKEIGASVKGAVLTWNTSKKASYVSLKLPNGNIVDKVIQDAKGNVVYTVIQDANGNTVIQDANGNIVDEIIQDNLTEVPLSALKSYTDGNTYKINSTKTWTLTAVEEDRGAKVTKTASVSYYYLAFWGCGSQKDGFNEAFIEDLSNYGNATSKGRTIRVTPNNEYVYYAVPKALCSTEPTFQIGDFPSTGGFEPKVEIKLTNSYGVEIDYYLYRSIELLSLIDGDKYIDIYIK